MPGMCAREPCRNTRLPWHTEAYRPGSRAEPRKVEAREYPGPRGAPTLGGRHQGVKSPSDLATGLDPELTQGRHLVTLLSGRRHMPHLPVAPCLCLKRQAESTPRVPSSRHRFITLIANQTPSPSPVLHITPCTRLSASPGHPGNPRTEPETPAPGPARTAEYRAVSASRSRPDLSTRSPAAAQSLTTPRSNPDCSGDPSHSAGPVAVSAGVVSTPTRSKHPSIPTPASSIASRILRPHGEHSTAFSSSVPGNRQRPRGLRRRNQYPPTRGQTSRPQPRQTNGPTSIASSNPNYSTSGTSIRFQRHISPVMHVNPRAFPSPS